MEEQQNNQTKKPQNQKPQNQPTQNQRIATERIKGLMAEFGIAGATFENTSGEGVRREVKWVQPARNVMGCAEFYRECEYVVISNGPQKGKKYIVFVAERCGPPPELFCTNGHEDVLHVGYLYEEEVGYGALFFVMHPKNWKPYQHRFKMGKLGAFLRSGVSTGASFFGGMATGAAVGSVVPIAGTFAGAVIGAVGGLVAGAVAPEVIGTTLVHIG